MAGPDRLQREIPELAGLVAVLSDAERRREVRRVVERIAEVAHPDAWMRNATTSRSAFGPTMAVPRRGRSGERPGLCQRFLSLEEFDANGGGVEETGYLHGWSQQLTASAVGDRGASDERKSPMS